MPSNVSPALLHQGNSQGVVPQVGLLLLRVTEENLQSLQSVKSQHHAKRQTQTILASKEIGRVEDGERHDLHVGH